eukprot:TRINITY_DN634_c0_g1_i2.p1 TRINITY_DN634_c0_g1~~TRINITY_DN634_c0_g1_i2.p1  ORF type:complete len:393 (-),score=59.69 TRINITY_DN634_c0_g1_i2:276-1403(-)
MSSTASPSDMLQNTPQSALLASSFCCLPFADCATTVHTSISQEFLQDQNRRRAEKMQRRMERALEAATKVQGLPDLTAEQIEEWVNSSDEGSMPASGSFPVAMDQRMSATTKKLEEQLGTFHVSASMLSGATVEINGIYATTSVEELLDKIEDSLCISCGCGIIVTPIGELFSRGQASISLADAGIVAGSTLNVIVRGTKLYKFKHAGRRILIDCGRGRGGRPCYCDRSASYTEEASHLLLGGGGICHLAFFKTHIVDHAGGPDHYTSSLECKNILVGTYVLDGDMAVCSWTKHFEHRPRLLDTFMVHGNYGPEQLVGPMEAKASAKYQRIDLSEYVVCDAIDPIFCESDLPTSALGLGLFETDSIPALKSRWGQ